MQTEGRSTITPRLCALRIRHGSKRQTLAKKLEPKRSTLTRTTTSLELHTHEARKQSTLQYERTDIAELQALCDGVRALQRRVQHLSLCPVQNDAETVGFTEYVVAWKPLCLHLSIHSGTVESGRLAHQRVPRMIQRLVTVVGNHSVVSKRYLDATWMRICLGEDILG
jgi:hypothetical protein